MSEPEDREIGPVATKGGDQGQPMARGSSEQPDTTAPHPRVPDTIGVYNRPTGLKRYPVWLIALVILAMLASVALMLFRFVF